MTVQGPQLRKFALMSLALVRTPALSRGGLVRADVLGGTHTGEFLVTIEPATGDPLAEGASNWWLVIWAREGDDSSVSNLVSKCPTDAGANYTYQSSNGEHSETGWVDEATIAEQGELQRILCRDLLHDPPARSERAGTHAPTLRWELIPTREHAPAPGIELSPLPTNPARVGVWLEVRLPDALAGQPLEVAVFDAGGRRVRDLWRIRAAGGWAALDWNLRDDSERRVRPGSYWVRAAFGDRTVSRAVTVLQ